MLFREFWYQSGISTTIRNDLANIAKEGLEQVKIQQNDVILDIGCNDGTLLSFIPETLSRIGFEPAGNMAKLAREHGRIVEDYFSAREFKRASFYKAKLVFAIAMFYDLENPLGFCREVAESLDDDGVFVVQQNYLGLMLQNTAYDNVCHEHLTYFSLRTFQDILSQAGLEVYHLELNQVNGGSMKTFIAKKGKRVVQDSVKSLELAEVTLDYAGRKIYRDFAYRVRTRARQLNQFLETAFEEKKNVMIYGAGTRGATLFEFSTLFYRAKPNILAAVDNNRSKQGLYYLDTGIPIVSREEALKKQPHYFLVLPYHLAAEIVQKEKEVFPRTQWLIPLPEFKVI